MVAMTHTAVTASCGVRWVDGGTEPVTLLAVVEGGPVMLVAADSLQIHANPFAGYGVTVDKLAQMGEEKIVWGYWGQVDGGTKLAHRLAQETFADWDALSDWVSEQATDLNGENPPFGALFAGWLGGQRKASAFGDQRVLSGDDFMFCGSAKWDGRWRPTLERVHP
jgi:hypothetical protein